MRSSPRSVIALAVLLLAATTSPAGAQPQLAPPVPGRVLLAFGASYGSLVHHGLDLAGPAGSCVSAPCAGVVSFAGRLPSGEREAVTIEAADGTRVTCSPLAELGVAKGEEVEAGQSLGSLAGDGDASSDEPHVHLSVREGELYLDPSPLLASAAPEPPPVEQQPPAEPSPAPAAVPSPAAAAGAPPEVPAAGGGSVPAVPAAAAVPAAVVPVALPSAAPLVPRVAAGVRLMEPPALLRPASPPPVALPDLGPAASRLRSLSVSLAGAMVGAAMLVPVVRRKPVALPAGAEAVPVRAES